MKKAADSPREVTVVNHWPCDFSSSTCAFPTAVFAGGNYFVDQSMVAATLKGKASMKKKSAAVALPSWCGFPFLDLSSSTRLTDKPKLKPRSRKSTTGIDGLHQHSRHSSSSSSLVKEANRKLQVNVQNAFGVDDEASSKTMVTAAAAVSLCGVENLQAVPPPRKISRSRAIAIKRNRDHQTDDQDEPSCASTERIYDWCTWRMYTRITDHRRRYPLKHAYSHQSTIPPSMHVSSQEDAESAVPSPVEGATVEEERFFDGEIFELEI